MCFTRKQAHGLSATIFTLVFLLHGARIINGWSAQIGPYMIPMWLSYVALLVAGALAYELWHMFQEKPSLLKRLKK